MIQQSASIHSQQWPLCARCAKPAGCQHSASGTLLCQLQAVAVDLILGVIAQNPVDPWTHPAECWKCVID